MQTLRAADPAYRFEVETNGTIVPEPEFDDNVDQYNVSPKLENSNNPVKLREKPAAYRFFTGSPKAVFKFVVAAKPDLDEVFALQHKYRIPSDRIWLMPEGSSKQILARRRPWIVEICKANGFRYSDRLHVQIWGSKKGV
jgi:organic radical activating enzyme